MGIKEKIKQKNDFFGDANKQVEQNDVSMKNDSAKKFYFQFFTGNTYVIV
jgi:hypothetical protein